MPRAPQPDLKTGIAEGLEGQDLSFLETFELDQEAEEAEPEAEAQEEEETSQDPDEEEVDESPQEAPEGESEAEGESDDDRETDEEAAVSEEDVPESYMGIDLTGIPAEKRQAIIDSFKEQDRYANRANQRAAELEKQLHDQEPAPQPEPEPEVQLSDEEILAKLGIDKSDDLFDVKAEFALPLAKQMLEMQNSLSVIQQERALDQFEVQWTTTLSKMEKDNGPLPISYDELLEFAAENDIDDAESAYLKYMTPRKKQISEEAAKAREEAKRLAKKNATTTRPRTAKTKPKPKDAKNFKEAFSQVETEQGVNMESLVKQLAQSL